VERRRWVRLSLTAVIAALALFALASCQSDEFVQQAHTEFFVQDYNPEYLDILWVVDDRSPMYFVRDRLVSEARKFFLRLDGSATSYRMAFANVDMRFSPGQLKPDPNPVILTKNSGTAGQRADYFGSILSSLINLNTDSDGRGFESALAVLRGPFQPRAGVPLVVVFISDHDDHSTVPAGQTAVGYYAGELLGLKGDRLLRVYSVNYEGLASGEVIDAGTRCATRYSADIDVGASFQDRYFGLARYFNADLGADVGTADLCEDFSAQIDLRGLRQNELPRTFRLESIPDPKTLVVGVTRDGQSVPAPGWTYDVASNEIVFETAPPEGTTIQISYL